MDKPVLARLQRVMQLREEVEHLGQRPFWPDADWRDDGDALTLLLDVPGCTPETLHLEHEEDAVTVSGSRAGEATLYRERPYGSFSRRLAFPEPVMPRSARANLQAGVLSIRFEKRQKTVELS